MHLLRPLELQVHHDRITKPGKPDLHGHVDELEDYFAELKAGAWMVTIPSAE